MDSIGGMNVIYFRLEDIKANLIQNPELLKDKKFAELFSGYIVATMLKAENGLDLRVGFPLKAVTKQTDPVSGPSLQQVIDDPSLIDDSDVDICIGDKDVVNRCQVTRVVSQRDGRIPPKSFLDVLRKKLDVQSDDNLILIISIEDRVSIDRDQISCFLSDHKIPYGAVYVVGKAGQSAGIFKCWRIHPDMVESEQFFIGVPL